MFSQSQWRHSAQLQQFVNPVVILLIVILFEHFIEVIDIPLQLGDRVGRPVVVPEPYLGLLIPPADLHHGRPFAENDIPRDAEQQQESGDSIVEKISKKIQDALRCRYFIVKLQDAKNIHQRQQLQPHECRFSDILGNILRDFVISDQ